MSQENVFYIQELTAPTLKFWLRRCEVITIVIHVLQAFFTQLRRSKKIGTCFYLIFNRLRAFMAYSFARSLDFRAICFPWFVKISPFRHSVFDFLDKFWRASEISMDVGWTNGKHEHFNLWGQHPNPKW